MKTTRQPHTPIDRSQDLSAIRVSGRAGFSARYHLLTLKTSATGLEDLPAVGSTQ